MLEENSALIKTITEYQNLGRHSETIQYQKNLHKNLMYLGSIADQQNSTLENSSPNRLVKE